jgi:hypothetical protein
LLGAPASTSSGHVGEILVTSEFGMSAGQSGLGPEPIPEEIQQQAARTAEEIRRRNTVTSDE